MLVAQAVSTVALLLLLAAGAYKMADPGPTAGALRQARLPASPPLVRGLGLTEIAAAGFGLAGGGPWLAPAALLYLGFALFTLAATRNRIPLQSCGCLGREDTPPSGIHVGYNLTATLAMALLSALGDTPVPWSQTPGNTAVYLGFGTIGAYLSYLLLTRLPGALGMTGGG